MDGGYLVAETLPTTMAERVPGNRTAPFLRSDGIRACPVEAPHGRSGLGRLRCLDFGKRRSDRPDRRAKRPVGSLPPLQRQESDEPRMRS